MNTDDSQVTEQSSTSLKTIISEALAEYLEAQRTKSEPAYKAELEEERKRREALEKRINELAEENRRAKERAEEAEKTSAIRSELQKLGVAKIDLAFRAIKNDIIRTDDGSLVAKDDTGPMKLSDYVAKFVQENPELLPARVGGGSGSSLASKHNSHNHLLDIERIKPGMDRNELEQIRKEIARIALQQNT
jgi:hypothetical protein